jgi:hypothetical protein
MFMRTCHEFPCHHRGLGFGHSVVILQWGPFGRQRSGTDLLQGRGDVGTSICDWYS